KLEAFDKVEKDLIDVKDRLNFYEKQLAAAQAKKDDAAVKTAEGKVAEKKKKLNELESGVRKARLLSPVPGVVAEVMAKPGDDVKAGAAAVKLTDNRLTVDFKLAAADGAGFKPGAPVLVEPGSGGTLAARVLRADGGSVTVELLHEASAKA